MSYLVLARKWRPQIFEDIAGQGHITRTLQNAIRANRIAHAYLFTGVRGVGKTTAARILAKALNCEKGPTPTPCNQCQHCVEITNGSSIDVLEIDGASNRGIDEVRQIIENVRYQPAKCRFKIYIVDEVHQVTKDAFNALLKTLEEPPPAVKFILATTEPHRLPETILSRCQRYDFRRISLREITQRLGDIARREGVKITDGALGLLAREADGSMRDAQSLLEQVLAYAHADAATQGTIVDESALQEILGLAERQVLYDLSKAVIQGDAKRCIEMVADIVAQGQDLARLSRDLVEQFRNLLIARLVAKNTPSSAKERESQYLLDLPEQEIADLRAQVEDAPVETLLDYFNVMATGDEEVARAANPRFALEAVLVRLATLPKTLPICDLIERLEGLEAKVSGGTRPVAAPVKMESQQAPLPSAPAKIHVGAAGDKDQTWEDFVAFVSKQKRFLGSHLQSGVALELSAEQLKIGVAERHHLNYLQDAENLSALKSLAKEFFAGDMAITFAAVGADRLPRGERAARAAPAEREGKSEMVKEALRIFGGAVKTVRREDN
ncbi:MAG: DNA polymerase III subunit gamma/tau [Alphaproteobacteria bacterium]